jgi:hypothetical protein
VFHLKISQKFANQLLQPACLLFPSHRNISEKIKIYQVEIPALFYRFLHVRWTHDKWNTAEKGILATMIYWEVAT